MTVTIQRTGLTGVLILTPPRFGDYRGFFSETYNRRAFLNLGISCEFVQDNHSLSTEPGTIRGLHFQAPPRAQAKLVRCIRGAAFDVAVDIRAGSETYGRWVGVTLSAENRRQLFVPEGFAHGFAALEPDTEIVYKCSDYFAPENERSVMWNDPDLAIEWPDVAEPIISGKDALAGRFADFRTPFE